MDGISNSTDVEFEREMVRDREAWHAAVHRVTELYMT